MAIYFQGAGEHWPKYFHGYGVRARSFGDLGSLQKSSP